MAVTPSEESAGQLVRVVSGLADTASPSAGAALQLDRLTYGRAQDCVQCGLCLPACPTYATTGQEANSPRGRIRLMKAMADGRIHATDAVTRHLDLCLDCRACETACPSGVVYHELIEQTRANLAGHPQDLKGRLIRVFTHHVAAYPNRLRLVLLPARLLQKIGVWKRLIVAPLSGAVPPMLLKLMRMLPPPDAPGRRAHGPPQPPGTGPENAKATAQLFASCVGQALSPSIGRQSIDLLRHAGCQVTVPRRQVCCGAIHLHSGRVDDARRFARANIDAFSVGDQPPGTHPFIVNHVAGCGAMLKEYGQLLRDDPAYADLSHAFAGRVRDISELLVHLEPQPPRYRPPARHTNVTYHDACHLAHAQRLTDQPRQVLGWIKGLNLIALAESDMCCGAAGIYNLTQPQMAQELGQRKVKRILETPTHVCLTANVGCAMQIRCEALRLGAQVEVLHPVTLLHEAYFGGAS